METQCTHCGTRSRNQRDGDGCHACLRGVMRAIAAWMAALAAKEKQQ